MAAPSRKPHADAVWIELRGGSGWGCACMAATLPRIEDEMLELGLIKHSLDVYQWAYNPGKVGASAGTHDLGGVGDFGQFSIEQRRVFCKWGWMPFPRTRQFGWMTGDHNHAAVHGCPHQVPYTDWQVSSGLAGGDGLGSSATLRGRSWRNFEKPTKTWQQAVATYGKPGLSKRGREVIAAGVKTTARTPISFGVTMKGITGLERGKPTGNISILQAILVRKGFLPRGSFQVGVWDLPTGRAYDAFRAAKGLPRDSEGRPTKAGFTNLVVDGGYQAVA